MRPRHWLLLFWIAFVLRGVFFAFTVPYWEGFDEYSHYARVEYLAAQGREPERTTPLPADVAASMGRMPAHGVGRSFDDYWQLPPAARPTPPVRDFIYEAQQPPVFYWIAAAAYRLTGWLSLAGHMLLLRLLCVLLASAVVPLAYAIARRVLASETAALSASAITAALPLYMYTATHVANDSLAIALGAAVVLFTLQRKTWKLALALGAALLTKAYFLAFLPAVALLILWRAARAAALAIGGALLISGWWYWGNWVHTGSLTGNLVLVQPSMRKIVAAAPSFPFGPTMGFAWKSFLWMGNWSWIVVRPWMYDVVTVLVLVGCAGIAKLLWGGSPDPRRTPWSGTSAPGPQIVLLSAFTALFAAAVVYFGIASYAAGLGAGTHGWYACCVATPALVLLLAGLRAAAPETLRPVAAPALALALATLELFGLHFYQLPYYAGLIRHNPQGGLPAAHLAQFAGGGFTLMLQRALLEKPEWLAWAVFPAWLLYLASTLFLIGAVIALARRERSAAR